MNYSVIYCGIIRPNLGLSRGWIFDKSRFMDSLVEVASTGGKDKKLLEQIRDLMRLKHYSLRTEQTYCDWVERFIRFHQLRHPREMGEMEVTEFLTDLARTGRVAAATQNQALSALLFLYKQVLKQEIGWLKGVERARKPSRLPVVLARDEVRQIFAHLNGGARLMAGLLYGSGLRLMARKSFAHVPRSVRSPLCSMSTS